MQPIVFIIIVFAFIYSMTSNHKSQLPIGLEKEVEEKTPWLKKTTDDIAKFMNYDKANIFISVRSLSFFSYFDSKKYDKNKLIKLSYLMKGKGWNQINSEQFDTNKNPNLLYTANYPINKKTIVLCKNGATLLIWTDNIIGKYDNENSATFVYLDFDYLSPCYNYTP